MLVLNQGVSGWPSSGAISKSPFYSEFGKFSLHIRNSERTNVGIGMRDTPSADKDTFTVDFVTILRVSAAHTELSTPTQKQCCCVLGRLCAGRDDCRQSIVHVNKRSPDLPLADGMRNAWKELGQSQRYAHKSHDQTRTQKGRVRITFR